MVSSRNQTILQKIRQNLGELGTMNALLFFLKKLLYRMTFKKVYLHKYYITRQPVITQKLVQTNKALDIKIKQINADDELLRQMDRPFGTLQTRFDREGECFVALKRGKFAGNLWLNFERYQEDEVRCTYMLRPAGKAAWDYDVFVVPEFRFSYTFAKLWDHANTVMSQRGILYVYSRINFTIFLHSGLINV